MSGNPKMVITGTNSITSVGHDSKMTTASVRAGISRLEYYNPYFDSGHNPIKAGLIEGLGEQKPEDALAFMTGIAEKCLKDLCDVYFAEIPKPDHVFLFLGVSSEKRPGPRYEGEQNRVADKLTDILKAYGKTAVSEVFPTGNASSIRGILQTEDVLRENPDAVCIVGAFDSLLAKETLDWFEKDQRLKSESFGRNQGFSPAQAAGFFIIESKKRAIKNKTQIIAEITGKHIAYEPAPFVSDAPSKGEGLVNAIRSVLNEQNTPGEIGSVVCDLNGEHYRAKEWSYAELRCFENNKGPSALWHPAEFMGSVGAASGPVLASLAASGIAEGWLSSKTLVFCSDDHGERGVVLLTGISENNVSI